MDSLSPQVVSAAKLPILNPNEFDLWKMRIEQYFIMTDYSLWEVILNGNSPIPTRVIDGVVQPVAPTTTEQRLARKNELKARGTLLMALLDKHRLKFNIHKNAKTLMEAIEKRTNESVSAVTSVFAASTKVLVSAIPNVDTLSDAVIYSFFTIQYNSPQLDNDDLKQIDNDDLEEMDLKWQMAMLTMRARRRVLFARECRSPKDTMNKEAQRRNVPVETSTSNALVSQCDGVGSYDWSFQAEEKPTNYALMAFTSSSSSSSDNEANSCSKACTKAFATLQSHYDKLTNDLRKSQFDVLSYKTGSESVEARLVIYQQNKTVFEEDIKLLKLDVMLRDNAPVDLRKKFEKAEQETDELKPKLDKFQTSLKKSNSGSGVSMPTSLVYDRYKSGEGYHVVPPPYTGTFIRPKPNLVFHDAPTVNETIHTAFNVEPSPTKPNKDMSYSNRPSAPIIEDWVSDSEDESEVEHPILTENLRKDIPKSRGHRHSWNRKACFVCKSLTHLIKDYDYYEKKIVQRLVRNHVIRGNHQHYARITHPHPQRHVVPIAVLTRSRLVPLTAARPVTTAIPQTKVQHQRPTKHGVHKAHSPKRRPINLIPSPYNSNFYHKVTTVKATQGNPQHDLKDKGVIHSGCSRHMTWNISYLSNFEEINGGYVTFGGNPKSGKITDKDTECIVLSSDFKMPDENHVLFRVPRENNMYNVDLKNIVPSEDFTCLFAKATLDESNLWHRRLGHINFKTMNKLVKGKFDEKADKGFLVGNSNTDADATFKVKEPESEVHVSPSSSAKTKKHDEKTKREARGKSHVELSTGARNLIEEFEDFSDNSINRDNAASTSVLAVGQNSTNSTNTFSAASPSNTVVSPTLRKSSYVDPSQFLNDPDMPAFEEITYSDDEEDVGAEADFSNLETNITVSPIPTTRVHKDHPVTQIIGELSLAPQTKRMTRMVKEQGGASSIQMQKVWVLVDLPKGKRAIGSKWVFRNKKDERGIVIRNKARFVAQGHTQEEGINYKEVFAPVARIEAIRLFIAYASFMGFMVYQMDVKSALLYGTIKEEVYVYQPSRFEDLDYPDKVFKVVKVLYGLHRAPRAWYETLANYLLENCFQRGKIDQTLFIKKQKASTPIDTEKPLLKDPDGEDVDVQIYSDYAGASLDRKSTTGGCQFLGCRLISWQCKKQTIVATSSTEAEYVAAASCCAQVLCIQNELLDYGLIINAVSSKLMLFGITIDAVHLMLLDMRKVIITEDTVRQALQLDDAESIDCLPNEDIFAELASMGRLEQKRKLKASGLKRLKKGRKIAELNADEDVTLEEVAAEVIKDVDVQKEESQVHVYHLDLEHAQKVSSMQDDEAEPAKLKEVIEVVTTAKLMTKVVTAAATTITAAPMPKASAARRKKGVVIRDPKETATPLVIVHSEPKSKDKGNIILVEEPKPFKKQAQIEQDEAYARELKAELNANINWNVVIEHMDFFKGMTYDEIRPIFEKHFNSIVAFLEKGEEELEEEASKKSKRKSETSEEKVAKKQKLDEEVEELKTHLQIIPNDEDDVYIEDETHQLFLSFISLLRNFDREDLEMLWKIVQERFASSEPKNFSDDFLINALKTMFEKTNVKANIWKNQIGRYGLAKVKS
nr:putative ribonuclease H-like domain-containing protein [Tanacetum cinerariifolium]